MIVSLPAPNAFPVGSPVRAGSYSGEVVELRGPFSVVIQEPSGRTIITTTSDMELDPKGMPTRLAQPSLPIDLFSFI